jgi:ATP-dependent DNA helicase 2 subunit 1
MNKIKGLRNPGITLIGFKPKRLIKPYHSLRSSYFLYPDDGHVTGSSQFIDALIDELINSEQVAIITVMSRVNQDLRFAALFPQK